MAYYGGIHDYCHCVCVCATDIPEVTLELQNERQRNWRDTPTPMNCKIKGVSPDMVVRS